MFGLSMEKLVIIAVVAAFIIGPQRLPEYAAKLARLVQSLKGMANAAKARMSDEMGEEYSDVDWKKLDPRQYDPRRIIRTALLDEPSEKVHNPWATPTPPIKAKSPSAMDAAATAEAGQ